MKNNQTVEITAKSYLCTGCGTCVSICPVGAIQMRETIAGQLVPVIEEKKCTLCGLCYKTCPGLHLNVPLPNENPFEGSVLSAYAGHSIDKGIRENAQSGGVVSALLIWLFRTKQIDAAIVTVMPEDGSLRPIPKIVTTPEEILPSQGSKYCPVPLNSVIDEAVQKYRSIAIVGLPCHLHGIQNIWQINKIWRDRVQLTIGLFCDRTLNYGIIDYLVSKTNVEKEQVLSLKFREKKNSGWPGVISLQTKSNKKIDLPSQNRIVAKDAFTPVHCRLCFDKMNIFSDISSGDAWGVRHCKEGASAVLVRTNHGQDILMKAVASNILNLEPISSENIFKGQGVKQKIQNWHCFSSVWLSQGKLLPEFNIKVIKNSDSKFLNVCERQLMWSEKLSHFKSTYELMKAAKKEINKYKIKQQILKILKVTPTTIFALINKIVRSKRK